jgi:hypothetical protein
MYLSWSVGTQALAAAGVAKGDSPDARESVSGEVEVVGAVETALFDTPHAATSSAMMGINVSREARTCKNRFKTAQG